MNEPPAASQPRKRVRTGCRTCRRRRRKCDEGKPSCENCKTKGLICLYGPKFTFVESKKQPCETSAAITRSGSPRDDSAGDVRGMTPTSPLIHTTQVVDFDEQAAALDDAVPQRPEPQDETIEIEEPQRRNDGPIFHVEDFSQVIEPDYRHVQFDDQQVHGEVMSGIDQPERPHEASVHADVREWNPIATRYTTNIAPRMDVPDNAIQPLVQAQSLEVVTHDEQTELDLICHYRYKIAPLFDLGVGALYYGIQVLLGLRVSSVIHDAVVALAYYHQTALTSPTGTFGSPSQTSNNLETFVDSEDVVARVLIIWRDVLAHQPSQWTQVLIQSNYTSFSNTLINEHRLLLSRLILAARILAPSDSRFNETHGLFYHESLQAPLCPDLCMPQAQLLHALVLLEHSLSFLPGSSRTRVLMDVPLLTAWQSCWHESQMWFASRSEELGEILCLPASNSSSSSQSDADNDHGLPTIVFSSGCAMVANIVHHLTAMVLLHHKPRLVKFNAAHVSSTSPTWHMQRGIGIAATCGDAEVWDPVVIAALIYAARKLSHRKQLSIVAETLRRAMTASGILLQGEIDKVVQVSEYG